MFNILERFNSITDFHHVFLTVHEAAEILDVTDTTVRRYIKQGKLATLPTLGHSQEWIFASSVAKLLAERKAERSKKYVSVH